MPGKHWKRSLKAPRQYEGLRRRGMSKRRAAAISNAPRRRRGRGRRGKNGGRS